MTAPIAEQIRLFAAFLSQFRQFNFDARWLVRTLNDYGTDYARNEARDIQHELAGAAGACILLRANILSALLLACSRHCNRLSLRLIGVDPHYTDPVPELADLRRLLDAALEADPDPMWYQPPAIPAAECNAAAREAVAV